MISSLVGGSIANLLNGKVLCHAEQLTCKFFLGNTSALVLLVHRVSGNSVFLESNTQRVF
jgi:hypothetical protein